VLVVGIELVVDSGTDVDVEVVDVDVVEDVLVVVDVEVVDVEVVVGDRTVSALPCPPPSCPFSRPRRCVTSTSRTLRNNPAPGFATPWW
jgi:hypothetical protein